jgi:hypothetical protein
MEIPRRQIELQDDPGVLSPPILAPLYACAKAVNVKGYVPQATLDVEVAGVVVLAGAPGGSPAPFGATLHLPAPLVAGQSVRARQSHGGATSNWSTAAVVRSHTADYPAGLPRPQLFPTPLFKCGARTGTQNLLVGCDVWITADGVRVGEVDGANNPQGIDVSPHYDTGQHVRGWASLCADPSPPSLEQVVQPPPLPLPTPGFDPIYAGADNVVVNGLANGATFTLSRGGLEIGTFACWGGRCFVGVSPPCVAGEAFSATQQLCPGDGPSPPGGGTVQPCSALPAPQVAPVADGATEIFLTDFVWGSEIKVFVNLVKTGDGSGPVVALTAPVPHHARIDVWQILGTCLGSTVQEVFAQCVAPPVAGDPSDLDLYPVATFDSGGGGYDGGGTDIDGFHYEIRGSLYYPAQDDGTNQPFNARLAATGRVPIVVMVHGAHSPATPSYLGYDYFQQQLARMGFVAVSVDERETDESADWMGWTQNIVRRAELAIASIGFLQQLDASDPILAGKIDFSRLGLMGHSRGGECVLAITERIALPGVAVKTVLSVAPVNSGATAGRPHGFSFLTILPAADGDVVDDNGAQFYDPARPDPLKTQLYVDHANHNYFNRQWPDDTGGGIAIMARPDHERILSTYGSALFRFTLRGDPTRGYLLDEVRPEGVLNPNVHLSYDVQGARIVDNYEGHPITVDSEGQPTAQLNGLVARDFPFAQVGGAFNGSFFGATTGNVSISQGTTGDFRSQLAGPADLTAAEVRVRAAEVYTGETVPPDPTGFRVGAEDGGGTIGWIDVDDVGGLPRPFDRRAFDSALGRSDKTKTMLSTFRFPGDCFAASEPRLRITDIRAIHLQLNRGRNRPIAFDDLEIVPST